MNEVFGRYALWYDAFNEGKDYAGEIAYVLERLAPHRRGGGRWLDVGCGTGHHLAALRAAGIDGEGLDRSAAMIARARECNPATRFHVGELAQAPPGPWGVISLLFHVVNYLAGPGELDRGLAAAAARLEAGGLLVLDFWNADAVRNDPPARRERVALVDGRPLRRIATPEDGGGGRIAVRYAFHDGPTLVHEEVHVMRPFARPNLEDACRAAGLEPLWCEGWRTARPLAAGDWYGLLCAQAAP